MILTKPSKADGRTFTCHGETARVEDDNIDDGSAVLELYFLGQHRRDLVILPLVLRRYVEQEYKYLQQEKRYYPKQRFGDPV
jgi:hypothetical protein